MKKRPTPVPYTKRTIPTHYVGQWCWIYWGGPEGKAYPALVTHIRETSLVVRTLQLGGGGKCIGTNVLYHDEVRLTPEDALLNPV